MGKYLKLANDAIGLRADNRGQLAEFDSPLFGRCYGLIEESKANLYYLTGHSVIQTPVVLPGSWVVRIVNQEGDTK